MPGSLLDFLDHFVTLLACLLSGRPPKIEGLREISLDEMIKQSIIVIVGKVVRIEEIPTPKDGKKSIFDEMAIATIEIEKIIVGSYENKHIDIRYYPRLTFEARFFLDQRCIFFVGENNQIVKGYAGKIPIERDKVEVRYILDESTRQTLKDFTQRIRDSKSRQELVADKSGSRPPHGDNPLVDVR
jgi:hypothetical protein